MGAGSDDVGGAHNRATPMPLVADVAPESALVFTLHLAVNHFALFLGWWNVGLGSGLSGLRQRPDMPPGRLRILRSQGRAAASPLIRDRYRLHTLGCRFLQLCACRLRLLR